MDIQNVKTETAMSWTIYVKQSDGKNRQLVYVIVGDDDTRVSPGNKAATLQTTEPHFCHLTLYYVRIVD